MDKKAMHTVGSTAVVASNWLPFSLCHPCVSNYYSLKAPSATEYLNHATTWPPGGDFLPEPGERDAGKDPVKQQSRFSQDPADCIARETLNRIPFFSKSPPLISFLFPFLLRCRACGRPQPRAAVASSVFRLLTEA